MDKQTVSAPSIIDLLGLGADAGVTAFGVQGTTLKIRGGLESLYSGSLRFLSAVAGVIDVDASLMAIGRRLDLRVTAPTNGRIDLHLPAMERISTPRRGVVTIALEHELGGDFLFKDGATGHGSLTVLLKQPIGCGLEVVTDGETGVDHVRVTVNGEDPSGVIVEGLPARVERRERGLLVRVSSVLEKWGEEKVLSERIGHETAKFGHPWAR